MEKYKTFKDNSEEAEKRFKQFCGRWGFDENHPIFKNKAELELFYIFGYSDCTSHMINEKLKALGEEGNNEKSS